jgi:long-chain fatty acid transport protein
MRIVRRVVFACAVGHMMVGHSQSATAAGFATAHFGGEQGSVVATNPTALYFNPAGIAFSDGLHLYLDGQLAIRHATWDHPTGPGDPTMQPASLGNTGSASLLNVFGAPALGATMKLGNFAFGAGVFVPFGGRESWSKNSAYDNNNPMYSQAADGVQRWHIIDGSLTFIYATLGAAYRFGPLSIGATGNLIPSSVSFTKAQNTGSNSLPNSESEGRASLDVSGTLGSFGVGAMVEAIADRLWIGASYQSQPGMGQQTLNGTLTVSSPGVNGTPLNVSFYQAMPDIYRLGARWRVSDDVELRLFGDFTRWSVMQTQCLSKLGTPCLVTPNGSDATPDQSVILNLRRNWKNTYNGHLGASYWVKPEVELFAGAAFETEAEPDATLEPAFMDGDSIQGSVGGRFFLWNTIYLAVSYTQLQFFNRDNTGLSTLADAQQPTQQADAGGKYTQWVGFVDANIEKKF